MNPDWEDAEIEQCAEDAVKNWWHGCMGDYCGAKLPEGVCAQKCIPPFEEDLKVCDGKFLSGWFWDKIRMKHIKKILLDALANGEITQIEHYKCVMGPGGPADTWERCTADCICDQPFCNCVPPEEGMSSETWFQPNLRDTTITCYPDPEE